MVAIVAISFSVEQYWYLKCEFNWLLNLIRQQKQFWPKNNVIWRKGQTYYYKLRVVQRNSWSSHAVFLWICEQIRWWRHLCEQNRILRQSNSPHDRDRPSMTNYWPGVLVHLTSTKNMKETFLWIDVWSAKPGLGVGKVGSRLQRNTRLEEGGEVKRGRYINITSYRRAYFNTTKLPSPWHVGFCCVIVACAAEKAQGLRWTVRIFKGNR